jgi:4-amino-4-deoxy-L-arabinose transferase-like glycosyltransferase
MLFPLAKDRSVVLAFWIVLLLGAALRLVALGVVPAGLNADEASSGVDALALVQTGMDRWGNRWPVWFPAWGSGMNPLYTYIAVPVVGLFGLDVVPLRAIGAVFGILTLPVTYRATRLYFGRDAALVAMALLAVLPWHVMSSRWALDSNLLPLFFTLGLFTIGKALTAGRVWSVVAFLPWAIAIYAYPAGLLPEILSGAAILVFFRRRIAADWARWLIGLGLALLVAAPFLMFFAKSYLGMPRLPLEDLAPFSIPALPASRLGQIRQSVVETLYDNLIFILGSFRDGLVWHQSAFFLPLTGAMPFVAILGAGVLGLRQWRAREPHVMLIVLASAIGPVLLLPLHLTRFNWFYIPLLMVTGYGAAWMAGALRDRALRHVVVGGAAAYVAVLTALFVPYYFVRYNDELVVLDRDLGNGFRIGLRPVLARETAASGPDEPVFVDIGGVHPYLYVLFYHLATIRSFQATRDVRVEDGVYRVSRFDRFVFEPAALPPGRGFVFVARSDRLPCAAPVDLSVGPIWSGGRCPAAQTDDAGHTVYP